ncbi:exodeoxyribonuclease VII small subunit [Candidatus Methylopumilus turicensis]|jgi:exodeoxyribonuclease VII small subunit|uniref:Exodeoxyribonuclease 7 small subunit n=1 Tax=Candidatus Methylopumilus turicensis TaxID=1581680 RepID=A0A0B7IT41_9PROT|nr:exodeoxyribonuclease VII small subunit [Candidatus Methylopumilus turicensis]CEN55499.1 Exodeoxyribonuclease 7 small subunit [Candidatus Methylopumilus turicensis]
MIKDLTETSAESLELTFEAAVTELESIVRQMESNQLPLQDTLAAFKRGTMLLHHCQKTLADVEQQVRILSDDGKSQSLQAYQDHD